MNRSAGYPYRMVKIGGRVLHAARERPSGAFETACGYLSGPRRRQAVRRREPTQLPGLQREDQDSGEGDDPVTFRRARPCPICGKPVALRKDGRIRWHRDTRPKPGGAPANPACVGISRLPDEQPGAARTMADTSTEPLLHIEEFTPIHGFPTGHARCGASDGLLAHNSGMATCEKCIEWEPDEVEPEHVSTELLREGAEAGRYCALCERIEYGDACPNQRADGWRP